MRFIQKNTENTARRFSFRRAVYPSIRRKERSIDVADLIIETKTVGDTGNRLVLYHGSKKGISGEIAPISREECDFGSGFYMGTSTLQPLSLICNEDKPKFYAVELDLTGLKWKKIFPVC